MANNESNNNALPERSYMHVALLLLDGNVFDSNKNSRARNLKNNLLNHLQMEEPAAKNIPHIVSVLENNRWVQALQLAHEQNDRLATGLLCTTIELYNKILEQLNKIKKHPNVLNNEDLAPSLSTFDKLFTHYTDSQKTAVEDAAKRANEEPLALALLEGIISIADNINPTTEATTTSVTRTDAACNFFSQPNTTHNALQQLSEAVSIYNFYLLHNTYDDEDEEKYTVIKQIDQLPLSDKNKTQLKTELGLTSETQKAVATTP